MVSVIDRCFKIAGLATLLLPAACDIFDPHLCTLSIEPGLEVEIVNAVTGEPEAEGAVAIATEGTYSETLQVGRLMGNPPEVVALTGAYERPGVYDLRITKPDFAEWRQDAVRVRSGECHVQLTELRAELQPL